MLPTLYSDFISGRFKCSPYCTFNRHFNPFSAKAGSTSRSSRWPSSFARRLWSCGCRCCFITCGARRTSWSSSLSRDFLSRQWLWCLATNRQTSISKKPSEVNDLPDVCFYRAVALTLSTLIDCTFYGKVNIFIQRFNITLYFIKMCSRRDSFRRQDKCREMKRKCENCRKKVMHYCIMKCYSQSGFSMQMQNTQR